MPNLLLALVIALMALLPPPPLPSPLPLGHVTESPVNWTMNARQYERFVEAPTARDCSYWGSAEMGKKCAGFLVFSSSPKNLKCTTDTKFKNVVICTWDRPGR